MDIFILPKLIYGNNEIIQVFLFDHDFGTNFQLLCKTDIQLTSIGNLAGFRQMESALPSHNMPTAGLTTAELHCLTHKLNKVSILVSQHSIKRAVMELCSFDYFINW